MLFLHGGLGSHLEATRQSTIIGPIKLDPPVIEKSTRPYQFEKSDLHLSRAALNRTRDSPPKTSTDHATFADDSLYRFDRDSGRWAAFLSCRRVDEACLMLSSIRWGIAHAVGNTPPPLYGHSMVHDPQGRPEIYLFGGMNEDFLVNSVLYCFEISKRGAYFNVSRR